MNYAMIQKILFLALLTLSLFEKIHALDKKTITDEQLIYINNIHQFLKNNLYDGRVFISCEKTSSKSSYKMEEIDFLTKKQSVYDENTIAILKDLHTSFYSGKDKSISKIRYPKITYFSKTNGQRLITFSCKKIHIGRKKLGLFIVPSKYCYIVEPSITLH